MTDNKPQRGRKAVDGAICVTERINGCVTATHKQMLDAIAPEGFSPWLRKVIETQYAKHLKGSSK